VAREALLSFWKGKVVGVGEVLQLNCENFLGTFICRTTLVVE
jgi:hypothetical protein